MCLPELSVDRGELGKLRREIRSGMQLGVWKVSPDKGKAVEPIQQGFHRAAGGEAERTPEVSVFDQGQPGASEPVTWSPSPTAVSVLDSELGHPVHVR